jgi:hypothetical protein
MRSQNFPNMCERGNFPQRFFIFNGFFKFEFNFFLSYLPFALHIFSRIFQKFKNQISQGIKNLIKNISDKNSTQGNERKNSQTLCIEPSVDRRKQ